MKYASRIGVVVLILLILAYGQGGPGYTIGAAGTPAPGVASVQGTAGGTPIPTTAGAPIAASAQCPNQGTQNSPVVGTLQIAAAVAGQKVYVCSLSYQSNTPGSTFKLVTGTGANCVSGTADLSGTYQTNVLSLVREPGLGATSWITPASGEVCVVIGGSNVVGTVEISYAQF